jgi:hypothetical protein
MYLGGSEVFRSNLTNGPVNYLTRASSASDDGTVFYSTNVPASLLVAGTNVLAVEVHQESPTSSDISFDLQLEGSPAPLLRATRVGEDWLLYWNNPAAVLEKTEDLNGPWSAQPGASPVGMESGGEKAFFRLRMP